MIKSNLVRSEFQIATSNRFCKRKRRTGVKMGIVLGFCDSGLSVYKSFLNNLSEENKSVVKNIGNFKRFESL